jgi:hypothetical protein
VFAWSIGMVTCLSQEAFARKQLYFGRFFWVQVWVSYSSPYFALWSNARGYGSSFQVGLRSAAPMQVSQLLQLMIRSGVSHSAYL